MHEKVTNFFPKKSSHSKQYQPFHLTLQKNYINKIIFFSSTFTPSYRNILIQKRHKFIQRTLYINSL